MWNDSSGKQGKEHSLIWGKCSLPCYLLSGPLRIIYLPLHMPRPTRISPTPRIIKSVSHKGPKDPYRPMWTVSQVPENTIQTKLYD